jgi:lysozyme family protein
LHEYSKSFRDAFYHIIRIEGTLYADHPQDRGGPVKFGITLPVLREFRQSKILGAHDIKDLKLFEAMEIYKTMFWDLLSLDKVKDPKMALAIFDNAVNCGPGTAVKLVQTSINKASPWVGQVPEDGVMGSETLATLNSIDRVQFGFQFFKGAQARYISIVKKDPTQMVFLRGWLNRTYEILENIL